MMHSVSLVSHSPAETEAIGAVLVSLLEPGTIVALYGDLAAGKTCMVRGITRAIAGDAYVHSPTFTLVNEYGPGPLLYHLDLYRIGGPEELIDLGCEEIFDGDAYCLVEWAERAEGLLPDSAVRVHLAHGGHDVRTVAISGPPVSPDWEHAFAKSTASR